MHFSSFLYTYLLMIYLYLYLPSVVELIGVNSLCISSIVIYCTNTHRLILLVALSLLRFCLFMGCEGVVVGFVVFVAFILILFCILTSAIRMIFILLFFLIFRLFMGGAAIIFSLFMKLSLFLLCSILYSDLHEAAGIEMCLMSVIDSFLIS